MNSPTVSVIMATYNHASFVKEAILSVLMQEGVDFEFLIADDGSSDSTREVVASVTDERIKFFPNEINRGACIVTNELIERASGEFVALINSDDYWLDKDKLAYQVKVMRESPRVGACFGRALFVDEKGKPLAGKELSFSDVFNQENRSQGEWLRYFFDRGNCICHPTMMIRKSCYEKLGMYNNRLRQLPDLDMWVRLVKCYDIFISERELIGFRILPGENASSQTSVNSIRTINEHYIIAEDFFNNVSHQQLLDGFYDMLLIKDLASKEFVEIEKVRLYLAENQWLGKPYQMVALLKLYNFLNNSNYHDIMVDNYGMDDRWFQKIMGEVDVLRPKLIEDAQELRRGLAHKLRSMMNTIKFHSF